MNLTTRTLAKSICGITGAALAGPGGALVGDLAGGLLAAALPGASPLISGAVGNITARLIERSSAMLQSHISGPEKQRINHDLQSAFRDSLNEALIDLGGGPCFPAAWQQKQRDVPRPQVFPHSTAGSDLWREGNPLGSQVCECFHTLQQELAAGALLPFDPPADQPAASVMVYLEAETPAGLNAAFYTQAIAPFLTRFGSLTQEAPALPRHLQRYLLDRTLVHLGEALKQRPKAWRAFNRLMLENLRDQLGSLAAGQDEILARLDAWQEQPAELADSLAELLGAAGRIEKQLDEGLDALFARVVAQHGEIVARLDALAAGSQRIEAGVQRVLRLLEDGRYVVEGAPAVPLDRPPSPGEAPFMGLQPFGEQQTDLFFGREMLTARLAGRLRTYMADPEALRFLALVGASGSGKSSLVRAGLIPALRRGAPLADGQRPPAGSTTWRYLTLTPTATPLLTLGGALAAELRLSPTQLAAEMAADSLALARTVQGFPGTLLLFVDQFEELFTQCRDEAGRAAWVGNLLTAAQPGKGSGQLVLLIALRADFYAQCSHYAALREALQSQQDYLGPMSREELREAIEEPARRTGWEYERGLVDLILRDVGSEPGALPLLGHALLETWKHRRGRTMTLESYAEAGGVRGAIAKTAETVYSRRFDRDQQVIARNILLRLTELGEGVQDTRRRARLSEILPQSGNAAAVQAVLSTLADARLVTTSEENVEIAHEALIREWPTLRHWLEEDRAGLRLHRQLTEAAQEWSALGQDTGAVYRGVRLKQVLAWAEDHDDQLSKLERDFVAYSQLVADREAAEREAQRQRELEAARQLAQEAEARRRAEADRARLAEESEVRTRLRNRIITGVGALAMAAAVLAALLGLRSSQNARRAEENLATAEAANTRVAAEVEIRATAQADALAQKATAEAAGVQAINQQATAEAASARAISQQATAEAASAEALRQSQLSLARELASRAGNSLERDPDLGLLLALESVDIAERVQSEPLVEAQNTLFRALQSANYAHVLRGHGDLVYTAIFSVDGSRVVTASKDGTAGLWQSDGTLVNGLIGHKSEVLSAVFSPDGSRIVTASADNTARIWDADGAPLEILTGHTGAVVWAAFDASSQYIVTTSMDGSARLWDRDGERLATLTGHEDAVIFAAFSPTGDRLLTAGADGDARLWSIYGTLLAVLSGHEGWVNSVGFSPDGTRIVTAGFDGSARLWDQDGELLAVFEQYESALYTAAFSPDGRWIVTSSDDGEVKLWTAEGEFAAELVGHTGPVTMAAFNPDSTLIVTASTDNTARLWRLDGAQVSTLRGHTSSVNTALFSLDGQQIVTASSDGTARLWDLDRLPLASFQAHNGPVIWVSYDPAGERIASGGLDNVARIWSPAGELLTTLEGHLAGVTAVEFSPQCSPALDCADGKRLVTASRDMTARLWRSDGTLLTTLQGHQREVRVARFSPNGEQILTADEGGVVALWGLDGSLQLSLQADEIGAVWAADYSADGRQFVTAGDDGIAHVWSTDGTPLLELRGHTGALWGVAFSPAGDTILTGSEDQTARLWSSDGRLIAELVGHSGPVSVVRYGPDGHLLLTSSYDGTARLWSYDPETEQVNLVSMLEGHQDWVSAADFSADGRHIVTGSWDSSIRQWNVWGDVEAMQVEAAGRVARTLTVAECQLYLHQSSCDPDF